MSREEDARGRMSREEDVKRLEHPEYPNASLKYMGQRCYVIWNKAPYLIDVVIGS